MEGEKEHLIDPAQLRRVAIQTRPSAMGCKIKVAFTLLLMQVSHFGFLSATRSTRSLVDGKQFTVADQICVIIGKQ